MIHFGKDFFVTVTDSLLEESLKNTLKAAGVNSSQTIAVAVSGGVDSMALLRACQQIHGNLKALTVDHGLRTESRAEANRVAAWCADLGIEHHIVTWEGDKPTTRIQREARRARYKLLGDFCKAHNIRYTLTAHHKDDQIETFFMRLLRGSGVRGLLGMARSKDMEGYGLLRPFLDIPKQELAEYLKAKDQPFVQDPSNDNLNYGRVKVRQWLANAEDYGINFDDISQTMSQARELFDFIDGELQKIESMCLLGNVITLETFLSYPRFLQKEFLRQFIVKNSDKDFPPRFEAVDNLHAAVTEGRTTTAGRFVWKVARGYVTIIPEEREG